MLPRHAREVGRPWFVERDHGILAAMAGGIAIWGLVQSIVSQHGDRFARAGALIVVMGFISIFIGSRHSKALHDLESAMDDQQAKLHQLENIERAQGISASWVFGITAFGTLIWAYGDLFMNEVFDLPP